MLRRATSFTRPRKWLVFIELLASLGLISCPLAADTSGIRKETDRDVALPRLVYRAVEGCPSEAEFRRLLRDELERNSESGVDARTFRVEIRKSPRGFRGELRIFAADDVSERAFEGKTCSEAAQALALALVFSLDPEAHPPPAESSRGAPQGGPGAVSDPPRLPLQAPRKENSSATVWIGAAVVGGGTGLVGSELHPYVGISGYLDYAWTPDRLATLRLELAYWSHETSDLSVQALPSFTAECIPLGFRFGERWLLGLGPSVGAIRLESEAKGSLVNRSTAVRTLPALGVVGRLRLTPFGQRKFTWFGSMSAEGFSALSGLDYLAAGAQDRSLLRVEPGLNFRASLELGVLLSL